MDDWLPVLKGSEFASQFKPRLTNGHEALLFHNGSHQGLVATTKKAGHGGVLDLGILDEAFAHVDARLEQALSPAMNTRQSPQLWVVSTAGTYEDSPYLWDKVRSGREFVEAGRNEGTAYFEWSAPDGADPMDESVWWSCMPALGHTTPIEAVRAEAEKMALSEFRRAYLNQWVTQLADPVIPMELWGSLVDARSTMVDPVALAFDVSPDRSTASIGAAGYRPDGLLHVEVVEHRSGTAWVAGELAQLVRSHNPVAVFCDPAGPAGSLLAPLSALNVDVIGFSAQEHAQSCGMLYDAAIQKRLRHLGTLELFRALEGAAKRPLTDAWAWSRKQSNVDISPLVSVTLALGGLLKDDVGVGLTPDDVTVLVL
jgi:hypothetical protein